MVRTSRTGIGRHGVVHNAADSSCGERPPEIRDRLPRMSGCEQPMRVPASCGLIRPRTARWCVSGCPAAGSRRASLRRLAELGASYGNGVLQLTSRAGLQLRGLPDPLPTALVDEVTAAGLLPAASHERVRNIVTSPLTGLARRPDRPGPLTTALDAGLIAVPELADLPGRFLFVLDDGRGDVVDLTFDLGYQATGPADGFILVGLRRPGPAGAQRTRPWTVLLDLARPVRRCPRRHGRLARRRPARTGSSPSAWTRSAQSGEHPRCHWDESATTPPWRCRWPASTLAQAQLVEQVMTGGPGRGHALARTGAAGCGRSPRLARARRLRDRRRHGLGPGQRLRRCPVLRPGPDRHDRDRRGDGRRR